MEWVQVERSHLLEYIAYVEQLNADHTKLQEQIKDAKQLAGIVEQTYKCRLDKLADKIIDQTNRSQYLQGLTEAYEILQGRK
jgi:hypothetical protein